MLARVTFDESHRPAWSTRPEVAEQVNPANPEDAGYVKAANALRGDGFDVAVHTEGALAEFGDDVGELHAFARVGAQRREDFGNFARIVDHLPALGWADE